MDSGLSEEVEWLLGDWLIMPTQRPLWWIRRPLRHRHTGAFSTSSSWTIWTVIWSGWTAPPRRLYLGPRSIGFPSPHSPHPTFNKDKQLIRKYIHFEVIDVYMGLINKRKSHTPAVRKYTYIFLYRETIDRLEFSLHNTVYISNWIQH